MTQVVLIRPGATVYDEQDRVQGVLDVPLSPRGQDEVRALAERLAPIALDALYCGPGESVGRTAEAVGRLQGLRAKRIDDLRNLDQGLWQGLQRDEIKRRNLKVYRQWQEDARTICPPQGETIAEALERVRGALRPLLKRHRDEVIGLVVAEPLARVLAAYLRGSDRITLDDESVAEGFETLDLPAGFGRNGEGG